MGGTGPGVAGTPLPAGALPGPPWVWPTLLPQTPLLSPHVCLVSLLMDTSLLELRQNILSHSGLRAISCLSGGFAHLLQETSHHL